MERVAVFAFGIFIGWLINLIIFVLMTDKGE